ncbi:hypothetical protein BH10BAC5_BH10BAC5_17040 [soil metagenome]
MQLIENSPYEDIGFGGSAGGAKSHGIRTVSLGAAIKFPERKILIFRRTYPDLLENHLIPLFKQYPHLRKYYHSSDRILTLPNGSLVIFGYAEHDSNIFNFQGKDYWLICIDEAGEISQMAMEYLKSRNRHIEPDGTELAGKMVYTFNWRGKGRAYLKRIFWNKIYEGNERAKSYHFIPAKIYDNVCWSLGALKKQDLSVNTYYNKWNDEQRKKFTYKYSGYANKLMQLPEDLRNILLEGNPDNADTMFLRKWNRDVHVIKSFPIPASWRVGFAIDYGGVTCAHMIAMSPAKKMYVIREWVMIDQSKENKALSFRNWQIKIGYPNVKGWGDHPMFSKLKEFPSAKSPAADFLELGVKLSPVKKNRNKEGDDFRVWMNEYAMEIFDWEWDQNKQMMKEPKIQIFEECKNLIATLPDLEKDADRPELISESCRKFKHFYDSMMYCAINLNPPHDLQKDEDELEKELERVIHSTLS